MLWFALAAMVGLVASARGRRPVAWFVLALAITPLPALFALERRGDSMTAPDRSWSRLRLMALVSFILVAGVAWYARLAWLLSSAP